jgi:hypothetical protein
MRGRAGAGVTFGSGAPGAIGAADDVDAAVANDSTARSESQRALTERDTVVELERGRVVSCGGADHPRASTDYRGRKSLDGIEPGL